MSAVESFPGTTVLVVGDVMLDEYVWGEVERISPEAPVPVVEVSRRTQVPGGAANAAAGVVSLGGTALLCGVIGDDPAGRDVGAALVNGGVDTTAVVVDGARPTTTKTRVIAHNQQVVRADVEDRSPLTTAVEDRLIAHATGLVTKADSVLLSDYAKGAISHRVARAVIGEACRLGRPIVVDPKGLDYAKFAGASVLTPNVHDASRAANFPVRDYADLVEVSRRLAVECAGAALLVTRGAAGMTLFAGGGAVDVAAEAREVFDVTGAGDTVVAVLAVALGCGLSLEAAVRIANTAAGIAVGKVGTATVTLVELEQSVR